jgi:hypothetical protein
MKNLTSVDFAMLRRYSMTRAERQELLGNCASDSADAAREMADQIGEESDDDGE